MTASFTTGDGSKARLRAAIAGGLLLVATWAAIWWLAAPRHDFCAMTYPAPAGCGAGRVSLAVRWSGITAVLYAALLLVPDRRWRTTAGLALVIAAVWAWFSVLYA